MPEASIYSLSHAGSLRVLQHQDLIAAFPKESITDDVASGRIKVLNVDFSDEATEIGIITRNSGFNSPAAEMFMDIIRNSGQKRQ